MATQTLLPSAPAEAIPDFLPERGLLEQAAIFPERVYVDGVYVDAFKTLDSLFHRIVHEIRKPGQSCFFNLNVHIANMAHSQPRLRRLLLDADVVYNDSSGISLAARLLGSPTRLTKFAVADWLFDLWTFLGQHGHTVYYLGGVPGVVEEGVRRYEQMHPEHNVVGYHHGYILNDPELEAKVIAHINEVKPDILFVGFGCPLQEYWIEKNKHKLNVSVFYPLGAAMDYLSGRVVRSPGIFQKVKLEWLFRLCLEPRRMFVRYVIGNPWFIARTLGDNLNKIYG